MKQGKQAANPLSFPRLEKFRALLTREACSRSPNSQLWPPLFLRAFPPPGPGRAGRSPPSRPEALQASRDFAARLARSARGGPRHVTAAGARAPAGAAPPVTGSRGRRGGPWAKPTAGAAPALPCERYPPHKHLPRSSDQPRPRSRKHLFSACAKSATPEAGRRGRVRACLLPPAGGTWRLPQRRPLLQPGAPVTQLHP